MPTPSSGPLTVGVLREQSREERRVALTPDGAARLLATGVQVVVEQGAGRAAWFPDEQYAAAGAQVVPCATLLDTSDVVVCVHPPAVLHALGPRHALVGLLQPLLDPRLMKRLADAGVTAISFDTLPRTVSRAQSMDALTSQASVAGYKAALVAADAYGGFFPMLTTAAGTTRPARVLVLGAGVAGLQAIATCRRLGAVVSAFDVRDSAQSDIRSLGGTVLDVGVTVASEGGYARQLTEQEQGALTTAVADHVADFDVVITTAQVPGRPPPLLVPAEALARMAPGSVVVDGAAGDLGGNVEGSKAGTTYVTEGGVTLVGAGALAAQVPRAASTAYSRNVVALVAYLAPGGVAGRRPRRRGAGRPGRHARGPGRPPGRRRTPGRPRMTSELLATVTVFVLALLVGYEVIGKVPATLHTPLMSGANAIHGVIVVGVMLVAATTGSTRGLRRAVRRGGLRGDERRRRLRRHRPDARDVPGPPQRRELLVSTASHLLYLVSAVAFVVGLHLMGTPATARRGNLVSAGGMVLALAVTVAVLVDDGTIGATALRRPGRGPRRGLGRRARHRPARAHDRDAPAGQPLQRRRWRGGRAGGLRRGAARRRRARPAPGPSSSCRPCWTCSSGR